MSFRTFVEMDLHRLGVGVGHGKRDADAARRANGVEQVGVVVALVDGLPRPGSALGRVVGPRRSSGRCGPRREIGA